MCCIIPCISADPIEDPTGRYHIKETGRMFQREMLNAPISGFMPFLYFCGQFCPCTMGCTQYALRLQALDGDLSRYEWGQGYFDIACCRAGHLNEQKLPCLCLFIESCCCNCIAVSATRIAVMDKYALSSDPTDYRLIRCNNVIAGLSCLCDCLAICCNQAKDCARILDCISNFVYHCFSGCMTAQVYYEIQYQNSLNLSANPPVLVQSYPIVLQKTQQTI